MEKLIKILDDAAKECGVVYNLHIIDKQHDVTFYSNQNTMRVQVEDYEPLNGIYDNLKELEEKAHHLTIANGEIFTDTRGWLGGTTVGHYRFISK